MVLVEILYTPKYEGAKQVGRSHNFENRQVANNFLARMKRMYLDVIVWTYRDSNTPSDLPKEVYQKNLQVKLDHAATISKMIN